MAQQMPLPLTISCSSKSRLVLPTWFLPFWYLLTRVVELFQLVFQVIQLRNRFTVILFLQIPMIPVLHLMYNFLVYLIFLISVNLLVILKWTILRVMRVV